MTTMADPVVLDMSLAALQRQDPYISSIVDVASQVALYTFNSKANEWEKTDTEGTLFIYTRLASPRHGFTIRNRLRPENLTEPITKDLDFQVQDPFLLYRNTHLTIRGIWFYNNTDCVRIAQRIKILSQQEQVSDQYQDGCVSPERGEKAVDILQLLNKARTEYNRVGGSSEPKQIGGSSVLYGNPNLIKPIPVKPSSQDTDADSADSRSRPATLDVLFGFSPHQSPAARAGPRPLAEGQRPESSSGGGRGLRPPVARSLSYDGLGTAATLVSGGPGPVPQGPGLLTSGNPVTAIMPGHTLQTLSESPESRLVENGAAVVPLDPALDPNHLHHHHHHHLLHHQPLHHHLHHHHLPQPLPLCWPRPPPQPAQPAGCRHPMPAAANPLFMDLCKLRQANPGQPQAYKQGAGVISPHELLQRLQLVQQQQQQQQQQQSQSTYSPARAPAGLAARFPAQYSASPGGPPGTSVTTTPQKPLQFHACPPGTSSITTTPGKDLQFQGMSPHDVPAPVLLSPSVFSQSKSSQAGRSGTSQQDTCPVLSRAQLQTTLLKLLQTDSSFLDSIYEAYLSTTKKY